MTENKGGVIDLEVGSGFLTTEWRRDAYDGGEQRRRV